MYRSTAKTGKHTDPVWQVGRVADCNMNVYITRYESDSCFAVLMKILIFLPLLRTYFLQGKMAKG